MEEEYSPEKEKQIQKPNLDEQMIIDEFFGDSDQLSLENYPEETISDPNNENEIMENLHVPVEKANENPIQENPLNPHEEIKQAKNESSDDSIEIINQKFMPKSQKSSLTSQLQAKP